jgi:hypothetical protein
MVAQHHAHAFLEAGPLRPFPPAIFLTCLAVVAHAGPVDCELNKVALARVVTKEARLDFIAGPDKRTPACPSAESACRLKAYLVPGDEVLVDATDGAYVCTFFKSQGGTETRGWLPRAALQIAPPEPVPLGNGMASGNATEKRRSSSNPVKMKWRSRAMRCGVATTRSASKVAAFTSASSTAKADHGARRWPSVMIPTDRAFRPGRIKRRTTAPQSWNCMVGGVRRPKREFHRNLCASEVSQATRVYAPCGS